MTSLLDPNPNPWPVSESMRNRAGRTILGPGQISDSGASTFSLLRQVEQYYEIKANIENVLEGVAHLDRIKTIQRQLSPNQRVLVFETGAAGQPKKIEIFRDLPGRGHLVDPQQTTITPIEGKSEICYIPQVEPPEKEEFVVEGRSIRLQEWDDYDRWRDDDFDDDSTVP